MSDLSPDGLSLMQGRIAQLFPSGTMLGNLGRTDPSAVSATDKYIMSAALVGFDAGQESELAKSEATKKFMVDSLNTLIAHVTLLRREIIEMRGEVENKLGHPPADES